MYTLVEFEVQLLHTVEVGVEAKCTDDVEEMGLLSCGCVGSGDDGMGYKLQDIWR